MSIMLAANQMGFSACVPQFHLLMHKTILHKQSSPFALSIFLATNDRVAYEHRSDG